MFREYLQQIVDKCEGAVAGVVMGFDGIPVEAFTVDRTLEVENIGMEFSALLLQVRKAAEILRVGALEEVSIRSEQLTLVVRVLNEEYFFGLVLRPEGNFGKGRFLMRVALPELRAQL